MIVEIRQTYRVNFGHAEKLSFPKRGVRARGKRVTLTPLSAFVQFTFCNRACSSLIMACQQKFWSFIKNFLGEKLGCDNDENGACHAGLLGIEALVSLLRGGYGGETD